LNHVAFTRCRPYRKNDQAWVEQKNGSVVRRLVGYRRFEGLETARVLGELYATSRDCQEFRVWAGIMGKKESHYVPTKRTCDPV
jgi:hypothetical protein